MPSVGNGTGWDEALPGNSDNIEDGPLEIRDLRKGVNLRMSKEHVALATASAGGEHKMGSAVAFYKATADEPANKPDGATPLDNDDAGRMWVEVVAGFAPDLKYFQSAAGGWKLGAASIQMGTQVGPGDVTLPWTPDFVFVGGTIATTGWVIVFKTSDMATDTAVVTGKLSMTANAITIGTDKFTMGSLFAAGVTYYWIAVKLAHTS